MIGAGETGREARVWHAGGQPSGGSEVRRDEGAGDDDACGEARALLRAAMGRVLRELREARGWSQPGMARRAGVPLRAVTRLELGQPSSPALRDVRSIVGALGFDVGPFVNAVEYRAVVLHADAPPRPRAATRQGIAAAGSSQARRAQQTRRALRSLADELWARVQDREQVGEL